MREQILSEIRKIAQANAGQPPGHRLFATQSGIRESAWRGVYWARWSDAIREAGLEPNAKQEKMNEDLLFKKLSDACRYYGRLPTMPEIRMYRNVDSEFPTDRSIQRRFHAKANMIDGLATWVIVHSEYADVAAMLVERIAMAKPEAKSGADGHVYLIRWGAHYKIGRGDQLERRVKEVRTGLPDSGSLVHAIRTDDPSGIEAYWHRRFADRRADNGEWFKLSASDVAAFKRRKFQ